jgi:hypothetical protein
MQTGMTVAEPKMYAFFFFENRVQSENRSAGPPYVPALVYISITPLNSLEEIEDDSHRAYTLEESEHASGSRDSDSRRDHITGRTAVHMNCPCHDAKDSSHGTDECWPHELLKLMRFDPNDDRQV